MITGADVFAERTRRKLSRTKFAELVGLTPTKVNNIEHGRRPIRPEEIELLRPFVPDGGTPSTSNPPGEFVYFLINEDEDDAFLYESSSEVGLPAPAPTPVPVASTTGTLPLMVGLSTEDIDRINPTTLGLRTPDPGDVTGLQVLGTAAPPTVDPSPSPGPVGVAALQVNGLRRISNSEVQTFKHCRRRWWLGWYRGLRLRFQAPGALSLGNAVHRSLAAYYVPAEMQPVDPREALEKVIAEDEANLINALSQRSAQDASEIMISFKKDADLARAMIEGYLQWIAETGADQGYIVDAPEQQLSVRIELPGDSKDVLLVGTLDLRLRREHDNVRLFLDHKTTASFEKLVRMLIWDEQMKHYHLLEEKNREETDPRVEGALYNMLRKVKRSVTAKPPFYQRVEVRHNPFEVKAFEDRIKGEALAIQHVERCLDAGVDHQQVAYPTPSDRCLWGCEFKTVCPMFDDNSRAEDFIAGHYVQINPLDRYDNEEVAT